MLKNKIIRTLIVEDDLMVQEIISAFVKKIDNFIIVGKIGSYVEALAFLERKSVDLVLLDVYLPDGLGIQLLKKMRELHIDADCILITADNSPTTYETAVRYGAVDYLIKPFMEQRFMDALQGYYALQKTVKQNRVIEQEDIDKLFHQQHKDVWGYKNQTYQIIIDYLQEQYPDGFTSSEIANNLGISRITARRYLESMERSGEAILELAYGTVGRPKNKYFYNNQGDQ